MWIVWRLLTALVVRVEKVLVVLLGGEALVNDEDDGGDEDDGDKELAIVDAEGLLIENKNADIVRKMRNFQRQKDSQHRSRAPLLRASDSRPKTQWQAVR